MAKRQTETKIWSTQRWYKKLHPYHKLVWKYLTDCCDHAGIWKVDYGQLVDDTGIEDFNLPQFIQACNTDFDPETGEKIFRERLKYVTKGIIWITGFVKFQYENKDFLINPDVPAIKSALQILNGYGILQEGLDKGYITLSKPFGQVRQPHPSEVGTNSSTNAGVENQIFIEKETDQPPSGTFTEPLHNPSETHEVGTIRTKDKDRDKDTLSKGYSDLEELKKKKESDTEVSKSAPDQVRGECDVGLCFDIEEYLQTHQIAYEAICMKYFPKYNQQEIKEILSKFHLWNVQKDVYPQKPAQLIAGFELWVKNEKNFSKNGRIHSITSRGKDATTLDAVDNFIAKYGSAAGPNFTG